MKAYSSDFRSLRDFGSLEPTAMTDGHKKALKLIAENKHSRGHFFALENLGLMEVFAGMTAAIKRVREKR